MNAIKVIVGVVAGAGFLAYSSIGFAGEKPAKAAKAYPLKTCLISGKKLSNKPDQVRTLSYKGQEIKLCSTACVGQFNKKPTKYLKKLSAKAAAAQARTSGRGLTRSGWTLRGNGNLFALGDAPSRLDFEPSGSDW